MSQCFTRGYLATLKNSSILCLYSCGASATLAAILGVCIQSAHWWLYVDHFNDSDCANGNVGYLEICVCKACTTESVASCILCKSLFDATVQTAMQAIVNVSTGALDRHAHMSERSKRVTLKSKLYHSVLCALHFLFNLGIQCIRTCIIAGKHSPG